MTDFLATDEPGTQALPGDLLYLGEDVEGWDLSAGYYVLAGQVAEAVVLTRRAGNKDHGDDDGEQVMVPSDLLARMTTRGVSVADLWRANARERAGG